MAAVTSFGQCARRAKHHCPFMFWAMFYLTLCTFVDGDNILKNVLFKNHRSTGHDAKNRTQHLTSFRSNRKRHAHTQHEQTMSEYEKRQQQQRLKSQQEFLSTPQRGIWVHTSKKDLDGPSPSVLIRLLRSTRYPDAHQRPKPNNSLPARRRRRSLRASIRKPSQNQPDYQGNASDPIQVWNTSLPSTPSSESSTPSSSSSLKPLPSSRILTPKELLYDITKFILLPVIIPPEFTIVVNFNVPKLDLNYTLLTSLRSAFSQILKIPRSHIGISRLSLHSNSVEMFFIKSLNPQIPFHIGNLFKASTILATHNLLSRLQQLLPNFHIQSIGTETSVVKASMTDPVWMQPYFPYIIASCAAALVTMLVTILVYCCYRQKVKKAELKNPTVQRIFYPTLKPNMKDAMMVQPESSPVYVVKRCVTPLPAQTPVQMRAEGLLKRRGSSASLTLDLNPSPELPRWEGTPPRESSGLGFLMSAGNRLSRKDLRNAVKNVTSVYEEFWDIPTNHPEKVYVAGSGTKNRYKTMIPNEHSRVILPNYEGDTLSSYINANYIRGYEVEAMAYIATQGPMAHTILDFWRMIWHEKAPIIVMITKLKEMNTADLFNTTDEKEYTDDCKSPWNSAKSKCENYLPDKYGCYGDIEVTVEKVTQRPGYLVHQLVLRCKGESHHVLHYWYTAWPDHKPPDSPKMILDLVQDVELHRYMDDGITPRGPIVVHCSAGIGRTGCFIAISIGIRQLREEHSVDILGIVCSMRMDRGGMIQTHEQYEFIHQALCEYEKMLDSSAD